MDWRSMFQRIASGPPPGDGREDRLAQAFAEEEYAGLRLATILRLIALVVIAIWITIENGLPGALFFYPFLIVLTALGVVPLLLRRSGRERPLYRYLFPFLDFTVIVVAILAPNPMSDTTFPATLDLRWGNEIYLFALLAAGLFTYSPRVVLWSGIAAALAWSAGTLWVMSLPGTLTEPSREAWLAMSNDERLATAMDPNRVFYGTWGRVVVVLLVVSATSAAAVWRSRRLVMRTVDTERQRANLSRYFSSNVVDELAESDTPITTSQSVGAAILFADIVGFTALCEQRSPAEVIDVLKEFHARMEDVVFAHGGTLDKYIGDAVMVTFGTPRPGDDDAARALRCAREMLRSVDAWNEERARADQRSVRIGIGVHYGPVIVGDVGGPQRLEYTVIGDPVNVASRLERLTRELATPLLVSGDLLDAARVDAAVGAGDLDGLVEVEPQSLRGRSEPLRCFALTPA